MSRVLNVLLTVALALSLQWNTGITTASPAMQADSVRTVKTSRSLVDAVDTRALARELLTPKSFRCLDRLIARESRWQSQADNPTSTAYGVGQLLDSTWRNIGMTRTGNANAQLVATLAYIGRRYGSGGPCAAWSYWKTHKTY